MSSADCILKMTNSRFDLDKLCYEHSNLFLAIATESEVSSQANELIYISMKFSTPVTKGISF